MAWTDASLRTAEELGVSVIDEVAYPDHYTYSGRRRNVRERAIERKAEVVPTRKDAAKIGSIWRHGVGRWAARLRVMADFANP
jgi:tetraacyldisaccharide-1-P 4'-kinase